jgi:hypothetical protein
MGLYTTLHLYNVPSHAEVDYASWFDGAHRADLQRLRGFVAAERYEVAAAQIMANIPQPWRYLSVYDFDLPDPAIDVAALGPLIAAVRDRGWIAADDTERLYTYALYSDWAGSANWQHDQPLSGLFLLLANYTPGRFQEYQRWYDEVHREEVTNVPGCVAMKRGQLSPSQIEPRRYCPGDQLVMCAQQTDDPQFTVDDFRARALGSSVSGIKMAPRSDSASTARTVHCFRKISGPQFWTRGIGYAGDLSVYPGKG